MTKTSQILDMSGKPIKYGNYDPNIISVDDSPKFEMRQPSDYPEVPNEVKKSEIQYILPMANFIAQSLGISIIEEKSYEKVLEQLKQRSLFVIMNLAGVKINQGVAEWFGLILMCKKHAVTMVKFKLQLSTGKIGISQCRIWQTALQKYIILGDSTGKKLLNREETASQILNYLKIEGICNV
jgi:hypothetical protein